MRFRADSRKCLLAQFEHLVIRDEIANWFIGKKENAETPVLMPQIAIVRKPAAANKMFEK
jgi:hypothetical protein